MPSPRFGTPGILVDAVAYAVREGWACTDPGRRVAVLQASLRRSVGDAMAGNALASALTLLRLQPDGPAGDVEPASVAELTHCVRCRQVKLSEDRHVMRHRSAGLAFLRDAKWMERQFERLGRKDQDVAYELKVSKMSVQIWRHRHGIDPGKEHRVWMQADWMRKHLVDEGLAPGEVAQLAGCEVHSVIQWARRLGVMPKDRRGKPIFAHHHREWWVERLGRTPTPTQYALAKMAGLKPHVVLYHLRKWGLYNPDRASKKRKPKYTRLYEPGWLAGQLQHSTKAAIARKVGCNESAVLFAAKKLGLAATKASSKPSPWTKDPEWWREHFRAQRSLDEMAAAAGISRKSAVNYIGELGLLDEYHREVERWSEEQLERTRRAVAARLAGRRRKAERVAV